MSAVAERTASRRPKAWTALSRRSAMGIVALLLPLGIGACGEEVDARAATSPSPDLPTARPVRAMVDDLAFDRSGKLLALDGGKVAEVDAQGKLGRGTRLVRGARSASMSGSGGRFSPDTSAVALFVGLTVRVVSRASGRTRWSAKQPGSVYDEPHAFWSGDASRLLLEVDGPALVFDGRTGKRLRAFRGYSGYFGRQPFSPGGRSIVLGSGHGASLVSVASGKRRVLPKAKRIDRVPGLDRPAWSPDGKLIADASGTILDVETEERRQVGTTKSGSEVAWSPDGRWLATFGILEGEGDQDAGVRVVEIASGQETVIAHGGAREERGELAWSADSRQVAYVSPPGSPCAPESGGGNLC